MSGLPGGEGPERGGPVVAVIVPAYDIEAELGRCVDSVLAQTHRALDVILVDDGSTDGTAAICDAYAAADGRVRAYHTRNGGLSRARNFGIERALEGRCEYIALVDGDDWVEPQMVEVLVEAVERHGLDAVQCGFAVDGLSGVQVQSRPFAAFSGRGILEADVKGELDDTAWNKLYARRVLEGVRYPGGRVYEDIATTCRALSLCGAAGRVPDVAYHYVLRPGSVVHVNTARNLADFWEAHRGRREFLLAELGEELGWEGRGILLMNMANAASKAWRWGWGCPRGDRGALRALLAETTSFARGHLPLFGMRGWPAYLRISCLVAHAGFTWLLPVTYCWNQLYIRLHPARSFTKR